MSKKASHATNQSDKFGAFKGVFLPTFLSILSLVIYLRLGYIVGSAGIPGTIVIILLAVSITVCTALSLSSITTNIRIGAGGGYSIISKTLGLEVGGSVGIPMYMSQTFATVFYIFGFSEVWHFIFPHHPISYVVFSVWATLFLLTLIRTRFAVNAQLLIFMLHVVTFISIFAGFQLVNGNAIEPLTRSFPTGSFWVLFALFFPGVTGIMTGIGMSGDLSDPKKQVPKGLMWGVGVTTMIYMAMALFYGYAASDSDLITNNLIIIQLAKFAPVVIIGILSATFATALTNFTASPRLLQALGQNSILPLSKFFAHKTESGEPRRAALFSSVLVLIPLAVGNLDSIAPVLTMFSLITYSMINLSVFIEQSLGLVSFRPTFRIPKIVSLYGALASIMAMIMINPFAGILAFSFLLFIYVMLIKKKLVPKEGDVRSGLFRTISEWAAKKVMVLPESKKHTWKPNILLPVVTTNKLLGSFPLIKSIAYPNGSMTVLGMDLIRHSSVPTDIKLSKKQIKKELDELPTLVKKFGKEGVFTAFSTVSVDNYTSGICISLEAIEGQVFHPNILFLPFRPNQLPKQSLSRIFKTAKGEAGIIIFDRDEDLGFGSEEDIHVWIHDKVLDKDFYEDRTFDLAMLVAYRLYRNWVGKITLWVCTIPSKEDAAKRYLKKLIYEARFPASTQISVSTEPFIETLRDAPHSDIHIIAIKDSTKIDKLLEISKIKEKSFVFVTDSGQEDILA
jgi:solute carrier family 12 (sodium/potassium/chloride transporter), member 2